jgi:hypothetical protein
MEEEEEVVVAEVASLLGGHMRQMRQLQSISEVDKECQCEMCTLHCLPSTSLPWTCTKETYQRQRFCPTFCAPMIIGKKAALQRSDSCVCRCKKVMVTDVLCSVSIGGDGH